MNKIRPQYHFRVTKTGLDAWNVARLIRLSKDLKITYIDPNTIAELDNNHWYQGNADEPTPRSIIEHMQLVQDCDVTLPIILDQQGRVMDGMHRVCRAVLEDLPTIPAVQFLADPEPDYVDCDPKALPYDDAWI